VGCGSDSPEPEDPGVIQVAALGDSITSGSPEYDPDPAQRAALGFGANERSQYEYWAQRKSKRGQTPLRFQNCGIYGQRTDEIAMRLNTCADGADVLVVQGGINDIAQGAPIDAAADNLRSMVKRGKQLGLRVYLVNVLPWNNGHPRFDDQITELNRMIDTIGRDQDVPVIDFFDALEDPHEAGVMSAELTADGDHPSIAGYRVVGELVARTLSRSAG
jgi:lysophospholipase L1-like esterase